MKSILVATDGSETAKKALMEARKLAECMEARVTIINVSNLPIPSNLTSKDHITIAQEALMANKKESLLLLDEALKVFRGFKGELSTVNSNGDPGEEIIKEAEEGDYDLVVMGSRGMGLFSRTILGSISNKVLHHVNKNVLIIK